MFNRIRARGLSSLRQPRLAARWTVVIALLGMVSVVGAVIALSPAPAQAICKDPPCSGPGTTTTTRPGPVMTRITSITPSFGWSGDSITLSGSGFAGASVLVNGQAASIIGQSATQLTFVVPIIMNTIAGPVTIPVVVSSPTGTASTSFVLSPTLQASAGATYGVNSQFGQGMDGSASGTVTIDRSSGFSQSHLVVTNTQALSTLTINMSTVMADSTGTVIGFTTPLSVSTTGVLFHWPSSTATSTGDSSQFIGPNPGVGPMVHSAQVVLVRDHGTELTSTLNNAVSLGMTIVQVIKALAAFA